jgi:hypothetical protein
MLRDLRVTPPHQNVENGNEALVGNGSGTIVRRSARDRNRTGMSLSERRILSPRQLSIVHLWTRVFKNLRLSISGSIRPLLVATVTFVVTLRARICLAQRSPTTVRKSGASHQVRRVRPVLQGQEPLFLRDLIARDKLKVVRVPDPETGDPVRRILIDRADLDEFIDRIPRE